MGEIRIMFGGKPVGFAKEGMLTYNNDDDGSTKDSGAWENPTHHSFEITGDAVVTNLADSIRELLNDTPRKVEVEILREMPNVMPRKMKKAYRMRNRYQRNTKWKRKAKAYARRFIYRIPDAEMVVTREQMGALEATIKGSSLQYNPDAHVSGKDIAKTVALRQSRR